MNIKNNTLSTKNYLLSYDLINRYNLKSVYQQPKIKKVYVKIFFNEFLEASDFANKKKPKDSIKMKIMLFFYVLFNNFPKVIFQQIKTTKSSKIRNDGEFIIAFFTTDSTDINTFLTKVYNNIDSKVHVTFDDKKINTWSLNIKMPATSFFEINDLFDTKIQDINLKKINLDVSIVYKNIPKDGIVTDIVNTLAWEMI